MITIIRTISFYFFMVIWTLFIAISCSPLLIVVNKYLYLSCRLWSKGLLLALRLICGINYKIIGIENLPEAPFIVASKHQSAFETILFWQLFLPPVYILKKELTNIPFFGWYLKRTGMIAIDRQGQSKALKEIISKTKETLEQRKVVIIFPEGTRTNPGQVSNRYLPGISALYSMTNVPVVPVALNSGIYWPGKKFLIKPGTITVKILEYIKPGMDREKFIDYLVSAIEQESLNLSIKN